jgi:hypothetical protein
MPTFVKKSGDESVPYRIRAEPQLDPLFYAEAGEQLRHAVGLRPHPPVFRAAPSKTASSRQAVATLRIWHPGKRRGEADSAARVCPS